MLCTEVPCIGLHSLARLALLPPSIELDSGIVARLPMLVIVEESSARSHLHEQVFGFLSTYLPSIIYAFAMLPSQAIPVLRIILGYSKLTMLENTWQIPSPCSSIPGLSFLECLLCLCDGLKSPLTLNLSLIK
jgi:hypothetical protein